MGVDVVIPAYNAGRFVDQAIQSALAQTLALERVIVVDDGSDDDTADRVDVVTAREPKVSLIRQANGGPSAARNAGLRQSNSQFVAFLDADDAWRPDKLRLQMELFTDRETGPGVVYCGYALTGESVERLPRFRGDIHRHLRTGNVVCGSSSAVVVRRTLLDRAGWFDEDIRYGEDWDVWLRLSRICHFDFVAEPLVDIRRPAAMTTDQRVLSLRQEVAMFDKLGRSGELTGRAAMSFRRRLSELGLALSDVAEQDELCGETVALLQGPYGKFGEALGAINRAFAK